MKKPLISIIIPFYNEELYLKRAINSVLQQSYQHIEIIFINDGSTDASEKIVKEHCKSANYRLLNTENKGPGNARNLGIKNALGSYITFLDADDELHEDAIQKMFDRLIQSNSDMAVCLFTMMDNKQQVVKKNEWNNKKIINAKLAISLLIENKLLPTVWGKLFKASIAKKCVFPDIFWKEDDVFLLQYIQKSNAITVLNDSLITIHCRKNSLTRQVISSKMIKDICFSYKKQATYINHQLKDTLYKNQLNTFGMLFLILRIDWSFIKNKQEVLSLFQQEVNILSNNIHSISFKKRVVLFFLKSPQIIGWKTPLFLFSFLKQKSIHQLKILKN